MRLVEYVQISVRRRMSLGRFTRMDALTDVMIPIDIYPRCTRANVFGVSAARAVKNLSRLVDKEKAPVQAGFFFV